MAKDIEEICDEKARKGDGLFAIAQAIYRLAGAQNTLAEKLEFIGYGTQHTMGPLPKIAVELENLAKNFEHLSVSASVDVNK